jgi:hypothetical protein
MTSLHTTSSPERLIRGRTSATTVAAVAAAALGVSLFMTVASIDVPRGASDADLLAWWGDAGHRSAGVVSGVWAVMVAVTIAVVTNHLVALEAAVRATTAHAHDTHTPATRAPAWLVFGRSMAGAVTAVWLVTAAVRGLVGALVDTRGEPLPGVDVLRFATGLNYALLGQSGMAVLALFVLAISVVVLRTALLGRWLGYLGVVCGLAIVGAVVVQYGAFSTPLAILWSLGLAVAIWRGPATAVSPRNGSPVAAA